MCPINYDVVCLGFKVLLKNMSFCPTLTSAIYKQSSFPRQKVIMALVSSFVQGVALLYKPGRVVTPKGVR